MDSWMIGRRTTLRSRYRRAVDLVSTNGGTVGSIGHCTVRPNCKVMAAVPRAGWTGSRCSALRPNDLEAVRPAQDNLTRPCTDR